jgi:hypothetical protein
MALKVNGKITEAKKSRDTIPEQKEGTYACLPQANVLDEKGQTNSHTFDPGLRIDLNAESLLFIEIGYCQSSLTKVTLL